MRCSKGAEENASLRVAHDPTAARRRRGLFHEGILFGSLWKLPVVYVCENNQYQ